jgi:hypothetical protein
MPNIPLTQKFHTVSGDVDTENKGSALANADRAVFTMQDIVNTVEAGEGSSVTSLVAGDFITLSPVTGVGDVTVSADIGGSGLEDQIPFFTADNTLGNSNLAQVTNGGVTTVLVGSVTAPTNMAFAPSSRLTTVELRVTFGTTPTAATDGAQGDVIINETAIYVCTVTGTPGTWKKVDLAAI